MTKKKAHPVSDEKKVKLSAEDAQRVQRLKEEIIARFTELNLIALRSAYPLDKEFVEKARDAKPEFSIGPGHHHATERRSQDDPRICYGSGEGMCLCYAEDECYLCW